jgi:transcriptional regulator with XRE-family HTH domain
MLKPEQIRAARALLRIEQQDLARRAHISVATVRRLEVENGGLGVAPGTLNAVQHALEAAGAEFIPDGVRRRRSRTPEEKAALVREIMAIAHRTAKLAAGSSGFTEDDLYDEETGLPV